MLTGFWITARWPSSSPLTSMPCPIWSIPGRAGSTPAITRPVLPRDESPAATPTCKTSPSVLKRDAKYAGHSWRMALPTGSSSLPTTRRSSCGCWHTCRRIPGCLTPSGAGRHPFLDSIPHVRGAAQRGGLRQAPDRQGAELWCDLWPVCSRDNAADRLQP